MAHLTGKTALVSGGARGMGATHCRAIVKHGGRVVIGDILDDEGRALAEELGDAAEFVHLDVTISEEWDAAVAVAQEKFGGLNVLVNNAGIVAQGALEPGSRETWDSVLDVNLTGTYLGVVAAKDALIASAPSSIVNISSTSGFVGSPEMHAYVASKFGVRGLTKSVAEELGPHGVRANSVHPGPIRTAMIEGMDVDNVTGSLGRVGEPEEVSALVTYLASDESSFSTGAEFLADGGQIAGTGPIS